MEDSQSTSGSCQACDDGEGGAGIATNEVRAPGKNKQMQTTETLQTDLTIDARLGKLKIMQIVYAHWIYKFFIYL